MKKIEINYKPKTVHKQKSIKELQKRKEELKKFNKSIQEQAKINIIRHHKSLKYAKLKIIW